MREGRPTERVMMNAVTYACSDVGHLACEACCVSMLLPHLCSQIKNKQKKQNSNDSGSHLK